MKAVSLDMILTSASTRADGSLGLRFSTPELEPSEKTTLFELLNQQLKVIIQPTLEPVEALIDVKNKLGLKTPGQRMRGILFAEWRAKQNDMLFEEYYVREMDKMIERRKQVFPGN